MHFETFCLATVDLSLNGWSFRLHGPLTERIKRGMWTVTCAPENQNWLAGHKDRKRAVETPGSKL